MARSSPSLLKTLTLTGASMLGRAGMMAGWLAGSLLALPAAAAGAGYSAGGWLVGLAGLAAGAALNMLPVYKKPAPTPEPLADGDRIDDQEQAYDKHEIMLAGDILGRICAFGGGLAGAFTGAALGAGLTGIVNLAETRQDMLNGLTPEEIEERKARQRRNDRNFH